MNEKKKTLRELLQQGQVFAPCVFDCLSVRAVEIVGFKAALLSGGALAYSMCGIPDLGLLTGDELIWMTNRMTDYTDMPIIVDADDGFGESPLNTYRLVRRLVKAGAMAVTIDDSSAIRGWERTIDGDTTRRVVSRDIFLAKIKAAVEACKGTDCMLIARTESMMTALGIDEAVERCILARRLGADMTMVIGLKTLEQAKIIAAHDPGWKMWPDVGATDGKPDVELEDIAKLGFNLVTMHYTEKGAMFGMLEYGKQVLKDGTTVYCDEHDYEGWLPGKDHHPLLAYWKKWLPMEDEFNDLTNVTAKSYDIKYEWETYDGK